MRGWRNRRVFSAWADPKPMAAAAGPSAKCASVAVCARKFVRATPKITIQRNWEKAREKAGLHGMHFHDWRHSAASALINAGVDLYTVGRVLGHKDSRSTARYSHLAVDTLAAAVGRIGQKNPATNQKKRA